ncbi:Glycerophosphoryl diester phosphodiesterase [Jatrophihabitans endophyticus]|uniref:Glycerophosphoryl diester phosphodiesterase n=1 Tax=Jatrophihabitans endophyticus TaxID=1206085 RepID=A0A1M5DRN2_9ACTN|nr:hypothetical protein [Jatrophihabitans endophyticus]SHF69610.1 Glycerophosphoryl diester phosphodiesterase [Jatrophihabitans endophyticus]
MTGPFLVAHRTDTASRARSSVAAGARYLEVDVRLVAGQAVVTHFRPVAWAGGRWERDNARVRRRRTPSPDLPVAELLDAAGTAAVLFDPKDRDPTARVRLVAALAGLVPDPAAHVVSTRDPVDLARFADAGFRTWRTLDTARQVIAAGRAPLAADGVTVRHRALTGNSVRALHVVTDTVVGWTVNSAVRARELVAMGVDGITTDRVTTVADVL